MKKLAVVVSALLGAAVRAQNDTPSPSLPEVTVSTPRGAAPVFEMPASVDLIDGRQLREDRLQVNLSEGLAGVPGLQIQNRQNYAQDLQISVRGFGARSTFGVRGVRLYVDGIPATLPDGQGQTSNIDIGTAERVEILRGPFSALYGNSSGGVVQVFTEEGEGPPRLGYSIAGGSHGTLRQSTRVSGSSGAIDYLLGGSRFTTDGFREHSAAQRNLVNGKLGIALGDDGKLTLVVNSVRLRAQDPLGLTASQAALAPRSAALATQFDTRKTVDQTQFGLLYERRVDAANGLRLLLYGGERKTVQFQSIPPAAQLSALSAGGVIDLARRYAGFDARWTARSQLAGGPLEWSAGLAYDTLGEDRKGYENFIGRASAPALVGVQGTLRRDERNRVRNLDPYLQAAWAFADRWSLEAGLRYSTVRFESDDRYIRGANGDDSGSARYRRALPVAALRHALTPDLNVYAAYGRGFETPTLNELSYRPDGRAGLNFGLLPSVNDSVELGLKARLAGGLLGAALFQTRTRDEIVTATNTGGRATFRNAGRTKREGFELGWTHETAQHWRTRIALTVLDARYQDPVIGQRIPGIARRSLFAAFGWMPPEGWHAGAEVRALDRIAANDANSANAAGYALAALHAGYRQRWERWEVDVFARVDNLFDRRTIGSVIVNEGNARYFEPAPGRNWTVGAGASYRF